MNGLRNAMYPVKKDAQANANLTATLEGYNGKIAAALSAGGLPEDALAPVYDCAVCRDEGYVYAPSRRMCACFEDVLNRRMLDELGLQKDQTFERFREDCFADGDDADGMSQRAVMRRNREICEHFADAYPETDVRDLLFTGRSGLGKTFLMQAIAHRVTERGFGVQYVSAYTMLDTMRKAYFENNGERLRPLMDAELLLIDDLGTEPLMENITVTQLFNLLNERQNAGRHTVLSTNLSISELKARYTERIVSRLRDERYCRILKFVGEDVRTRAGKPGGGFA
jgi:DNA replication protein DnaC